MTPNAMTHRPAPRYGGDVPDPELTPQQVQALAEAASAVRAHSDAEAAARRAQTVRDTTLCDLWTVLAELGPTRVARELTTRAGSRIGEGTVRAATRHLNR